MAGRPRAHHAGQDLNVGMGTVGAHLTINTGMFT